MRPAGQHLHQPLKSLEKRPATHAVQGFATERAILPGPQRLHRCCPHSACVIPGGQCSQCRAIAALAKRPGAHAAQLFLLSDTRPALQPAHELRASFLARPNLPVGQNEHFSAPVVFVNVPLGQAEHVCLPASRAKYPALHLWHVTHPTRGCDLPCSHLLHIVMPSAFAYSPGLHSWHAEEPTSDPKRPMRQRLHACADRCPVAGWYLPILQARHVCESGDPPTPSTRTEYSPVSHARHTARPVSPRVLLPAAHVSHSCAPAAENVPLPHRLQRALPSSGLYRPA